MPSAYQPRPCRKCGGHKDTGTRGRRSWYCTPCDTAIYNANVVRNAVCENHPAGVWPRDCDECVRIRRERHRAGCLNRKRVGHSWYRPENAERFWQHRAHTLVGQAVKRELIPNLKVEAIACVDCGDRAWEYDHRDYQRPFDIEPVCRSCNKQRGTAIWPTAETFKFKPLIDKDTEAANDCQGAGDAA